MFYYQVLPQKKLPMIFLTYRSKKKLVTGQLVIVKIKVSLVIGLIIQEIPSLKNEATSKIKDVHKVLPIVFNKKRLVFLKNIVKNSFNHYSVVFDAMVQSIEIINQKNLKNLSESLLEDKIFSLENSTTTDIQNLIPDLYLDEDIIIRIIYLIRISITKYLSKAYNSQQEAESSHTTLVIFPENKMLDLFLKNFSIPLLNLDSKITFNVLVSKYTGTSSRSNQETVIKILLESGNYIYTKQSINANINIYFGTKSSIFLPFSKINNIILIDEPSSFYYQDQNSFYYDAREVVFLLASVFGSDLNFISTLPSIRLLEKYPNKVLSNYIIERSKKTKKPLRINLFEKNSKNDTYSLFSNQVLQILTDQQDFNEIFTNDEQN
jgi:primosomal protein N'